MKTLPRISTLLCSFSIVALLVATQPIEARSASSPRIVLSADADWKFMLGDPAGAESSTFDDQPWRTLSLPHDWSIEAPPAEKNPMGASGGYFPAGIGWYRKAFTAPASWKGKRVTLEFDGVSGDSTLYLNGKKLGTHPYAYTSFYFDITDQLIHGAKNVLAVRADNSLQPNSRWYSGSGIYRHVRVVVTDPVHIAPGVCSRLLQVSPLRPRRWSSRRKSRMTQRKPPQSWSRQLWLAQQASNSVSPTRQSSCSPVIPPRQTRR